MHKHTWCHHFNCMCNKEVKRMWTIRYTIHTRHELKLWILSFGNISISLIFLLLLLSFSERNATQNIEHFFTYISHVAKIWYLNIYLIQSFWLAGYESFSHRIFIYTVHISNLTFRMWINFRQHGNAYNHSSSERSFLQGLICI